MWLIDISTTCSGFTFATYTNYCLLFDSWCSAHGFSLFYLTERKILSKFKLYLVYLLSIFPNKFYPSRS